MSSSVQNSLYFPSLLNARALSVFSYKNINDFCCAINKLSVNFKKTNYMLITSSKKEEHLNIHNIERKSDIKCLGIYLDEHLKWETQIQHVNNTLAKNVGIINT